jgi:hypothetical protein
VTSAPTVAAGVDVPAGTAPGNLGAGGLPSGLWIGLGMLVVIGGALMVRLRKRV